VTTFHQFGKMGAKHYDQNPNLKVAVIAIQRTWHAPITMHKADFQQIGDSSV